MIYLTGALLRVAREVEEELQRLLQIQFFNFQFIEVVKLFVSTASGALVVGGVSDIYSID